jgi:colanic acid/amylovoran biosynthesis glycosyltransferase
MVDNSREQLCRGLTEEHVSRIIQTGIHGKPSKSVLPSCLPGQLRLYSHPQIAILEPRDKRKVEISAMKICFILNQYPELSQTFVLDQIIGLRERGHEVEVIAGRAGSGATTDLANHGYSTKSVVEDVTWANMPASFTKRLLHSIFKGLLLLPKSPTLPLRAMNPLQYGWFSLTGTILSMVSPIAMNPRKYDAIIAHFGPQGVIACAMRDLGVISGPLLTFFHGYDLTSAPRKLGRGMYKQLFNKGDVFSAICERGKDLLCELGAPSSRITVHHMGIHPSKFPPLYSPPNRDHFSLLSVGRLTEKKGFAWAIKAVRRLIKLGHSIEYRIIGEGPLFDQLRAAIGQDNLRDHIVMLGAKGRDDITKELARSNALLVPSITAENGDEEGIPMVIMESLATKTPVIATRHGGIEEIVQHMKTGLLMDEGCELDLQDALTHLWSDSELYTAIAEEGHQSVIQHFNLENQLESLEETLNAMKASMHSSCPRASAPLI